MTTLCLIHGWASNAHIFDRLRRRLPENWQIIAPNLAGHGGRAAPKRFDIRVAADEIAAMLPENSVVLGWSLGGVVAQYLAAYYPKRVQKLVLCATFAKLHATQDYSIGIKNNLLNKMLSLFEQDYPKHIRQFLQWQLLHSAHAQEILDALLPDALHNGTPKGLAVALEAVAQVDTRTLLSEISCPTLLIYGNKDAITPPRMGEFLKKCIPHAQFISLDKAAHTPFLSHADEVANLLHTFIQAA